MPKRTNNFKRIEIPYFDGVNSAVGDHVMKLEELFHGENVHTDTIGVLEKRGGYQRLGAALTVVANYGLHYSEGLDKIYRISNVGGTVSVYYLNGALAWTALTGAGTGITATEYDFTEAEQNLFFVGGGASHNSYIESDGTSVSNALSTSIPPYNHVYNSPPAYKINYYKDRLYLADYTLAGGTRQKNGIMFSSPLVGIVSLVNEDHASPVTTLNVEDTKYIYATDTLEVHRGGTQITATLGDATTSFNIDETAGTVRYTYDTPTGTDPTIGTVLAVGSELVIAAQNFNAVNNGTFILTAVAANYFEVTNASGVDENSKTIGTGSITINTISVTAKTESTLTIKSFAAAINSADELWVRGTKLGNKWFRWAGDGAAGTDVKEYDTLKLDGPGFDEITLLESVGDVQVIASKKNVAVWNGYNTRNFNVGIGCASSQGYVLKEGILYFIDYDGIAATDGEIAPIIISKKLKRIFDGASRTSLESSVGMQDKDSVYFYIGDVTLYYEDGSIEKVLSDVLIEYNHIQNNLYTHVGIEAEFATAYITQSSKEAYIAFSDTTNDNAYLFPYGTHDNDSEIFFNATTGNITLAKSFENIVYPREIIIETPQGSSIKGFISLDNGQPYEIKGDVRKGCTILYVTPRTEDDEAPRCRNLKISIRESSKKSCKINRIAVVFETTEEEELYHK